jgi:copper chaperone
MSTVKFNVPAISCGHCVHTIQMELGELEGVRSVQASLEKKDVTVTYEDPATEKQIISLLQQINYPPQLP